MVKRSIYIDKGMKNKISELAKRMGVNDSDIIREFLSFGLFAVETMTKNGIDIKKSNEIFDIGIESYKKVT